MGGAEIKSRRNRKNSKLLNIVGDYNIGIGQNSLYYNNNGSSNIGIGVNSLINNTFCRCRSRKLSHLNHGKFSFIFFSKSFDRVFLCFSVVIDFIYYYSVGSSITTSCGASSITGSSYTGNRDCISSGVNSSN